jgi:hypothetical protein
MNDKSKAIRVADPDDVVIFVTTEDAPHGFTPHKKVDERLRERVAELKENYDEVMGQVLAMVDDSQAVQSKSGFHLSEICVGLAFDAKGKLGFIAGVEAGIEATVTVTLRRGD